MRLAYRETDTRALVLASGGVDSSTLLALAVEAFGAERVHALSIAYGQRHAKELEAATAIAEHFGVELHHLDLAPLFAESACSLLAHSPVEVPKATYEDQLEVSEHSLVSTYVPFRNGLFLSAAASMALSLDCSVIYYGAHLDDSEKSAYPDCSEAFVQAMADAVSLGTGGALRMEAPFVQCKKADIVAAGHELNVPWELTWSCYEGGEKPCGLCATCLDRAQAFAAQGIADPLTLQ